MTVAMTSIFAYKEHQETGKLGNQARSILHKMDLNKEYSRREIVQLTGLELSSVCGRVNEMLQAGVLKEVSQRKCSVTGKTVKPVVKISLF